MANSKKKTTKKTASKKATVAVQPLGALDNHAGVVLSINMKAGAYFGVGTDDEMKVWLSPDNWHTTVPKGLTESEALQITLAIQANKIVVGKTWIPAITKAVGTIEEYVKIVKTARMLDEKVKQVFRDLVARGSDGGYTALEILSQCLSFERSNRNRDPWLIFIQAGIDSYQGPLQLVEDFVDEDAYEVTIDKERGVVIEDTGKKDDLHIPVASVISPEESKAAAADLDKFLN